MGLGGVVAAIVLAACGASDRPLRASAERLRGPLAVEACGWDAPGAGSCRLIGAPGEAAAWLPTVGAERAPRPADDPCRRWYSFGAEVDGPTPFYRLRAAPTAVPVLGAVVAGDRVCVAFVAP